MEPPPCPRQGSAQGSAVVMVLVLTVLVFAALAVFSGTGVEPVVVTSEADYPKTLAYAEAGLAWAKSRIYSAGPNGLPGLFDGPDRASRVDDGLIGLRELRLRSTAQFARDNEAAASAIVIRDFGDGSRKYEAVRMPDGPTTRALVYVRIDDEPGAVVTTAVAEYPVLVNGNGTELTGHALERSRTRRKLRAAFRLGDCALCGTTLSWREIP